MPRMSEGSINFLVWLVICVVDSNLVASVHFLYTRIFGRTMPLEGKVQFPGLRLWLVTRPEVRKRK